MLETNLLQKQKPPESFIFMSKNKIKSLDQSSEIQLLSKTDKLLLQLQGECKISQLQFLRLYYLKAVTLMIPITLSIIGLFLLKNYTYFRSVVFYVRQQNPQKATHVYITANQGQFQEIQCLSFIDQLPNFVFKKLKYFLKNKKACPNGLQYWQKYKIYFNKKHIQNGLDKLTQIFYEKEFGKNQHLIDIPSYFSYMFDIMTKPFFIIQYIICIMFILQKIAIFAYLLFGSTILTTSINYLLLRSNYSKTKEIAEKTFPIKVIRQGKQITIQSSNVLPSDIILIQKNMQIPCDCILVAGSSYMNESTLTGESIPVSKYRIQSEYQLNDDRKWLYEGTIVLDCQLNSKAIAINTGYLSRKGRIIRKMVNKSPKMPDIFRNTIYFLGQTLIVGILIYIVTLPILLKANITQEFRIYRFFDFIGFSCPPTIPVYFNIAYSLALYRLKKKNVFGTQPDKTIVANQLKTVCFDKTGTLTQNQLLLKNTFLFHQDSYEIINSNIIQQTANQPGKQLILEIFSSCHSVKQINGKNMGDQIDLKMFQSTFSQILTPDSNQVKFTIKNSHMKIDIIKINQFQSKFQHMSVLIFNHITKKYSLFVKGAPEKIHSILQQKYEYFDELLQKVSLQGLRSIGLALRQISQNQIDNFLKNDIPRNIFESQIAKSFKMVGLVTFENKLKAETQQTINMLNQCLIDSKIITGDNIFIAIQTAFRSGIISSNQNQLNSILVLEGKHNQKNYKNIQLVDKKYKSKIIHFLVDTNKNISISKEEQIILNKNQMFSQKFHTIAIDNDFFQQQKKDLNFDKIKIFARITPQNKAEIIKCLKKQIDVQFQKYSFKQKLLNFKQKIAMVGDGSNDLIALKQANIGFGMSKTDASYGSSFSIQNLTGIQQVIKQSKNTSIIAIQCFRYYGSISFLKITASILMMTQSTYFSGAQLAYSNFTTTLLIPIAITLGNPQSIRTHLKPITNTLSINNHLIYWGNIIIPSLSIIFGYFYFYSRNQFSPNPIPRLTPQGFHTLCHTNTVNFLLIQIPFAMNGFLLYNLGKRFKQHFYKNWILMIIVFGNFIADISHFFATNTTKNTLGLQSISKQHAGILLLISLIFLCINYIYNQWVSMFNYQMQKQQKQQIQNKNSITFHTET